MEGALHSTQKDGILTVDQALVKQAWERVSNRVREAEGCPSLINNLDLDIHCMQILFLPYLCSQCFF